MLENPREREREREREKRERERERERENIIVSSHLQSPNGFLLDKFQFTSANKNSSQRKVAGLQL